MARERVTYMKNVREINEHMCTLLVTAGNIEAAGNDILGLATLSKVVRDGKSKPSLSRIGKMVRTVQCMCELDNFSPAWKDRFVSTK